MHLALLWVMSDLYCAGDTSVVPLLERIAKERLIVFAAITDPAVSRQKAFRGIDSTVLGDGDLWQLLQFHVPLIVA